MNYTIKARPTVYGGIHFRSRLEATWAAMFDQLGWRWEYEHEEIAGWLPDFTISSQGESILAEIKPHIEFSPGSGVMKKLENSRGGARVLLLDMPSEEEPSLSFLGFTMPCPEGCDEWCGAYLTEGPNGFGLCGILSEPLFSSADPFEDKRTKLVHFGQARRMWGEAKKATRYEPA
jgi:hypothetical protein